MKPTKKNIAKILRTLDTTQIFKLAKSCGVDINNRHLVYMFITQYSPTKKVTKKAYGIASSSNKRGYYKPSFADIAPVSRVVNALKNELKTGKTSYSKILIEGNKSIYWASPVYQHSDYNKSRALLNTEKNRKIMNLVNKILKNNKIY